MDKEFTCNICGNNVYEPYDSIHINSELFKKHTVIGGGFRPKSVCSRCLSTDRNRFLILALQKNTNIFIKKCDVLEIGPSITDLSLFKRLPKCNYVTLDKRNPLVTYRKTDITDMHCIRDNSFDYILCNHVLEHVENEAKAISELKRVCRPYGTIEISVPIDMDIDDTFIKEGNVSTIDRIQLYGQSDHVKLYGRNFKQVLDKIKLTLK
jgi:SAM-dependent methyltransferase